MEALQHHTYPDARRRANSPQDDGKRYNLLYLGDHDFKRNFRELNNLREAAAREREQEVRREDEKAARGPLELFTALTARFGVKEVTLMPDREEIFLEQFPGLSKLYRTNRQIISKQGSRYDESFLMYGNWAPPSFCQVIVSIAQLILTLATIHAQRAWILQYWMPQYLRQQLQQPFENIQT